MDSNQPSQVVPMTPHTIQALKKVREANDTPSRNRRGISFVNRRSPRDVLRSLSRGRFGVHFIQDLLFVDISLFSVLADEVLAPSLVASNDAVNFSENVEGVEEQGDAPALSEPTSTFRVEDEEKGEDKDEINERLHSSPLNFPLFPEATENREQSVEIARHSARQRTMMRSSEGSIGTSRMDSRFIDMPDTPSVTLMEEIQNEENVLESSDGNFLDKNSSFVNVWFVNISFGRNEKSANPI